MCVYEGKSTLGSFFGRFVFILTTVGAKLGRVRETSLAYSKDGERHVVIVFKGGVPSYPAWYHNLVANPEVTVEVLGEEFRARARVAEGDERDRLFWNQTDQIPNFYQY